MRPLRWTGAVLCFFMSGCFWVTTKAEGDKLRSDVDRIDRTLGEKVNRLEQVLQEATGLLKRNSADLGAEVQSVSKDQARVAGLVEEARRLVSQLQTDMMSRQAAVEDRLTKLEKAVASGGGTGGTSTREPAMPADDMFAMAKKLYDENKYDESAALFLRFASQHADHKFADDALYMRAEAFTKSDNLKAAIGEFQRVFEKYPKSDLADRALFRAGESSEQLKFCTDARAYFGLLRQKYPKSELAKKAKQKDDALKAAARNPKKCKN